MLRLTKDKLPPVPPRKTRSKQGTPRQSTSTAKLAPEPAPVESDSETDRSLAASVVSAHEIDEDYTPTESVTRATRSSSKIGLLPNYRIPHNPPRKTSEASTSRTPAISVVEESVPSDAQA